MPVNLVAKSRPREYAGAVTGSTSADWATAKGLRTCAAPYVFMHHSRQIRICWLRDRRLYKASSFNHRCKSSGASLTSNAPISYPFISVWKVVCHNFTTKSNILSPATRKPCGLLWGSTPRRETRRVPRERHRLWEQLGRWLRTSSHPDEPSATLWQKQASRNPSDVSSPRRIARDMARISSHRASDAWKRYIAGVFPPTPNSLPNA